MELYKKILFLEVSISQLKRLKGIVHPKMLICWMFTHPQAIQEVYTFVFSSEQIWRNVALHHLLTNAAVNGCRQNERILSEYLSAVWLSLWRHPFTAVDPLVSKWCNATFLQICSDQQTNSSTSRMSKVSTKISIWKKMIFLGSNSSKGSTFNAW